MHDFGEDVLVPMAAIFFLFGLPILAFILFRVLRHRERMAMIYNGVSPDMRDRDLRRATNAPAPAYVANGDSLECAQRTLRKGISLTFIGFAITLGLSFIGYNDGYWHPGPWLLGGLVPMFVGIAQVIIAILSGASLRPPTAAPGNAWAAPPPPPGPPPPPAGPPPVYDTSYTYRPGDTQELRPPRPPERR